MSDAEDAVLSDGPRPSRRTRPDTSTAPDATRRDSARLPEALAAATDPAVRQLASQLVAPAGDGARHHSISESMTIVRLELAKICRTCSNVAPTPV